MLACVLAHLRRPSQSVWIHGSWLAEYGISLDEVGHVERHLLDLRVVELLDVLQVPHVALQWVGGELVGWCWGG